MATLLKNLKVKSVDFVNAGANPDAHIKLYKSKEPPTQTDDGNIIKSLSDKIAKALQGVFKEAKTFDEQYDSKKAERLASAVREEVWTMTYALNESICSIVSDEDIDDDDKRLEAIQNSLSEFMDEAEKASENWAARKPYVAVAKGKMSAERLEALKEQRNKIDALISQNETSDDDDKKNKNKVNKNNSNKEEIDTMVIEKSKMTPEELAFFEEIEKKYGSDEGTGAEGAETPPVTKKAEGAETPEIHPEVAKALNEVEEIKKSLEMQKMVLVAKKYEILGKQPEELAKSLVEVKKAGDSAYNSYIAALDAHLDTVEKSGVFKEFGTSAEGGAGSEWAQIEKAAGEIMAANPNLTREQAIDKACQNHPELVQGYEKSLTGRR